MKTVIFVNCRRLAASEFESLVDRKQYRLVGVSADEPMASEIMPLRKYFDAVYTVPTMTGGFFGGFKLDQTALIDVIAQELAMTGNQPEQIRLVSNDEFALEQLGEIRERLHIPGPGMAQMLRYRDKRKMKEALAQAGVRIPRFETLEEHIDPKAQREYLKNLVKRFDLPLVVKPTDGASSMATYIVKSHAALQKAYRTIMNKYQDLTFEVNEYIGGQIYHCDMVHAQGKTVFAAVGEYLHKPVTFQQGLPAATKVLKSDDLLAQRMITAAHEALIALGNVDGVTHMELFHTSDDEIVFLEVAARPPGGPIGDMYRLMFGLNMFKSHLQAGMGEVLPMVDAKPQRYYCVGMLPQCGGKVIAMHEPNMVSRAEYEWQCQVGEVYEDKAYSMRVTAGRFYVSHESYEQLSVDFETLRHHQFIEYGQVSGQAA